jgi:hypothetical protein
MRKHMS